MLKTIINAINDKKGEDITLIDVSNSSPICEYFVLTSASNERQLLAIANSIDEELAKNNLSIKKIEGKGSKWLIVDVESVIIHIFTKEERENYNLEKLWAPFPKLDITEYLN